MEIKVDDVNFKARDVDDDFDSSRSFTGEVASIIADGPYSHMRMDIPKIKPILGTYNTMKCKVCNRSYNKTLYKDGDSYICKECKKESDG